ncbi:MAG: U32 family peptidase [Clostridia bacterium]|nr:U32 family peptidase [Clostridia bacterium]
MSVEILAPAGDRKSFFAAINAGANAIYLGLSEFSARKNAENFSLDDLSFYINYAHFFGVKIYVAVNTLVKEREIADFANAVARAYDLGADAFILQEVFLGKLLKEKLPGICLHLSTQAGVCNEKGAYIAKEYGFSRVILARETSFDDIKKIADIIETEVFVQGALCTCFSGHCYMSSFAGGFSGNRGLCKQPCRKKYTYSGEGFKSFTGYNLSLADLCLKDEVSALIDAGVKSFKIEGRMRSPEYVYSAVSVYKRAADGKICDEEFVDLRRSFNRGDYTKGYFTGNTRGIISSKIQGNIGDFIGNINGVDGSFFFVDTNERFNSGDGFKVIGNGVEICGAKYLGVRKGRAAFTANAPVKVGYEVRITKDVDYSEYISSLSRKREITVGLSFPEGKKAVAIISDGERSVTVTSDEEFLSAQKHSLNESELTECFGKVDEYPFSVKTDVVLLEKVFAPKSVLNAFRRKCYAEFFSSFASVKNISPAAVTLKTPPFTSAVKDDKIAVISSDFSFDLSRVDVAVFKPDDYSDRNEFAKFFTFAAGKETYLYVPPFATGADLKIVERALDGFDGIYAEGFFGINLAKETGKKLFAGTGFNVFNSVSAGAVSSLAEYYAYSKELAYSENVVRGDGFTLCLGDVQVMDLVYCPFSENCAECKRKNIFFLTDEDGRKFTVRRYKMSRCRFEVYNPYRIVGDGVFSGRRLFDFTTLTASQCNALLNADNKNEIKIILPEHTSGNLVRGVV